MLTRKPGALAGSTALAAARASGAFTAAHQLFWDAARRTLGDGPGTRALIGVLLLHRTLPAQAVAGGIEAALTVGNFDPDLVAVEARRTMLTTGSPPAVTVPATASAAASINRPTPSLTDYDQLLSGVSA